MMLRTKSRVMMLVLLAAAVGRSQDVTCDRGDVAWVSSAVNANRGLGAGAGRCLANTVAGAEYNNSTTPWGIQAALDCACPGLKIRVLGDTGDYGSATASWNNRFDANKTVVATIDGGSPVISITGYADTSTDCRDTNSPAGCPVEVNFTGGVTSGLTFNNPSGNYQVFGLSIHGATTDCVLIAAGANNFFAGMEMYGCLDSGFRTNSVGLVSLGRSEIHNTGNATTDSGVFLNAGNSANNALVFLNWIHNVAGIGVRHTNSRVRAFNNIIQNTGADCVVFEGANRSEWYWNTLRDCAGDGFDVAGVSNFNYGNSIRFNLITGAGGWGINTLSVAARWARIVAYNVGYDNFLGNINPVQKVAIKYGNVDSALVTYASATDSTPVEGANMTLFYPRGETEVTINAGAVVEGGGALVGGGGGGVHIPGGPR